MTIFDHEIQLISVFHRTLAPLDLFSVFRWTIATIDLFINYLNVIDYKGSTNSEFNSKVLYFLFNNLINFLNIYHILNISGHLFCIQAQYFLFKVQIIIFKILGGTDSSYGPDISNIFSTGPNISNILGPCIL